MVRIVIAEPEVADALGVNPDDVEVRLFLAKPHFALCEIENAIVMEKVAALVSDLDYKWKILVREGFE